MAIKGDLHVRLSRARVHDHDDIVSHALLHHLSLIASQLEWLTGNCRKSFVVVVVLHKRIHFGSDNECDAGKNMLEL
jgi:hypothetical protein